MVSEYLNRNHVHDCLNFENRANARLKCNDIYIHGHGTLFYSNVGRVFVLAQMSTLDAVRHAAINFVTTPMLPTAAFSLTFDLRTNESNYKHVESWSDRRKTRPNLSRVILIHRV